MIDETKKSNTILEAHGLSKQFFGFMAVKNVNLRVQAGTIHALIGPNGAGKTTMFNLLTKFLTPSAGRIVFKGKDITGLSAQQTALLGMVRSFQISAVFTHLTVIENVRVALQRVEGGSLCFWKSEKTLASLDRRAIELLEAVGLAGLRSSLASELAYGQRRALEIATTLALDPELMLLDEPMAGMDNAGVESTVALIRSIAANRTILMVEHNMGVVAQLCDTITVLARGEVIAEGGYGEVSRDARVRDAYLGAEGAH